MVTTNQSQRQRSEFLITEIANELLGGRDPKEITDALERIGWSDREIQGLLEAVDSRIISGVGIEAPGARGLRHPRGSRPGPQRNGGSSESGFLLWIGFLVGFNILSFVFDWGWIVY